MKFENIKAYNFQCSLYGMRNPKNSWHLIDSEFGIGTIEKAKQMANKVANIWVETYPDSETVTDRYNWLMKNGILTQEENIVEYAFIGPKDMRLARALITGGSEHRKFLRQIFITFDITAPLFYFKEFDTYKVGTTANSTSTMHKLTSKPITLECFEIGDYNESIFDDKATNPYYEELKVYHHVNTLIDFLEHLRQKYLETNDMKYWKELVRWLPEGWLQTRTWTGSYENLRTMYYQRKNHKLTEWRDNFCSMVESLPYAKEFIID